MSRPLSDAIPEPGFFSARPSPAADEAGVLYYATDREILYRWNGTDWDAFSIVQVAGSLLGSLPNPDVIKAQTTWQYTGISTPSALSSTPTNNYDPDGTGANVVYRISSSIYVEITGLLRGAPGRVVILQNIGSNVIALLSENTNSSAINRFGFGATDFLGSPIKYSLPPNGAVQLMYDSTAQRWRLTDTPAAGRFLSYKDGDPTQFISIDGRSNSAFIDAVGYGLTLNFGGFFKLGFGGGNTLLYSPDGTHLEISPNASGNPGLLIIGKGSQSASLQEWQNNSNTVLSKVDAAGNIIANTAGVGFQIKEGSNARMGQSTLSSGTVVVSNTSVTANTRILLTHQGGGSNNGNVRVSARTAGTSFTITSDNALDSGNVAWLLIEPS